ncbi:GNAT family N-acetyltransferase [Fictibacillus iocasae]|uniref:GNAT family N-acetyltransferase n=1 Tax=Fictibacillus iocasae TaxID=2715437 RepID=A0ABW2NPP7_9BACL
MVTLTEINADNWYECCQLQLTKEQEAYMEPNAVSIAQSKFQPSLKAYAIYHYKQMAGFLMFNSEPEELGGHWVYRIMIDQAFQGKGIGKQATSLMIAEMEKLPGVKNIVVGYHPDNMGAHRLYKSLGFVDHGDRFGKEMAVVKPLKTLPRVK